MGGVQRQALQRRAARETLERALAMFEELGARPWADKAREELGRISGRHAPSDELTEAELRVAVLAAAGRHNKEIAAELFLGVGTVERHLTNAYRKLGVRSRTELAGRFSREQEQPRHGG
jgi:DNA-binding NarL/FixJ family response regulator